MVAKRARVVVALPVLAGVLLLGGCGQDPSATGDTKTSPSDSASTTPKPTHKPSKKPTPQRSPAPAAWAKCAATWHSGATLPTAYAGCADGQGLGVPAEKIGCSSGQTFVLYGDHYFGVLGGTVTYTKRVLQNSPVYAAKIAVCRG